MRILLLKPERMQRNNFCISKIVKSNQCSQTIMKECRHSSILREVLETERSKAAQWRQEVKDLQQHCQMKDKERQEEEEAWKQECRQLKEKLQKGEVALQSMSSSLNSRKTLSLRTSEQCRDWHQKYEEAQSTCFKLYDSATKSSEEMNSVKAEYAQQEEHERHLKLQLQQALDQVKVQEALQLDSKMTVRQQLDDSVSKESSVCRQQMQELQVQLDQHAQTMINEQSEQFMTHVSLLQAELQQEDDQLAHCDPLREKLLLLQKNMEEKSVD